MQLINFNFVPVRHQLNVVLTVSVVWTALLSAWYPPEEEKSEENDQADEALRGRSLFESFGSCFVGSDEDIVCKLDLVLQKLAVEMSVI